MEPRHLSNKIMRFIPDTFELFSSGFDRFLVGQCDDFKLDFERKYFQEVHEDDITFCNKCVQSDLTCCFVCQRTSNIPREGVPAKKTKLSKSTSFAKEKLWMLFSKPRQ